MSELSKYQVKCRLKKGDQVVILSGRCSGQSGKIERVDRKTGRVYLSGVHTSTKHTKPSMGNPQGGRIDKVTPLPIGKVALQDPTDKKATRVAFKVENDRKVRVAVHSKRTIA